MAFPRSVCISERFTIPIKLVQLWKEATNFWLHLYKQSIVIANWITPVIAIEKDPKSWDYILMTPKNHTVYNASCSETSKEAILVFFMGFIGS